MTDRRHSVLPDLIDALVERAPEYLPADALVEDGLPTSWNVGDWLYVGVTDPDAPNPTPAATITQDWPLATATGRDETGTLTCVAYVERGDTSMKDCRDAAFAILGAVMDLLRDDVRLGVLGMVRTSFAGLDLDQGQTPDGAVCIVTFRIDYKARI